MANHPLSWPGTAYFVPKGTSTSVVIKPSYSYTTSDVRRLLPVDRKCLYTVSGKFSMSQKHLQGECDASLSSSCSKIADIAE